MAKRAPSRSFEHLAGQPPPPEPLLDRWYAVCAGTSIGRSRPFPLTRFGRELVLWRDAGGAIRAAAAACPHRGANLGLGRVVAGQLECGYHGFRYGADGGCTRVPCQPPQAAISRALRLAPFGVVEAHGLVWMGPGVTAPAGDPPWPADAPGPSASCAWTEAVWPARLGRVVEAMLDFHHLSFAHHRFIRGYERLADYQVAVEGEQIHTRATLAHLSGRRRLSGELSVAFPASLRLTLGDHIEAAIVLCPLDDEHTWVGIRYRQSYLRWPWLGRLLSRLMLWAEMRFIQVDDERLTASARPRSADLGDGHLVAADRGIAEWYRLRRALLHAQTAAPTPR